MSYLEEPTQDAIKKYELYYLTELKESWNGNASEQSLSFLLRENENKASVFYQKVDTDNIGISGHSQGGVGVFTSITEQEHSNLFKTAVALSPTNEEQAVSLQWHYDLSKIKVPILMIAGTAGDFETELVLPIEKMNSMYEKIDAPKVMMRKTGCEHGDMLYSADGYVTAWFMWQLQNDEAAAKAFIGNVPEIMRNKLYQDQRTTLN